MSFGCKVQHGNCPQLSERKSGQYVSVDGSDKNLQQYLSQPKVPFRNICYKWQLGTFQSANHNVEFQQNPEYLLSEKATLENKKIPSSLCLIE